MKNASSQLTHANPANHAKHRTKQGIAPMRVHANRANLSAAGCKKNIRLTSTGITASPPNLATIVGTLLAHGVLRQIDRRNKELASTPKQSVSTEVLTTQEKSRNV